MSTSLVVPLRSSSEHELERVFFIGSIAQSKQGLPFLAFPDSFYDDQLIKYYYPGENDYEVLKEMPFLSEANKKKSESFKRGDNPILIYYTLNKF